MNTRDIYYFDHCGATPLNDFVREKLVSDTQSNIFGNASAVHHPAGLESSVAIEDSRRSIAKALNCGPEQIVFTSGASEANNLMILGFWMRFRDRGCRVLYGATEHKSVLEAAKQVGDLPGGIAFEIPVDTTGVVKMSEFEKMLLNNPQKLPTLVALMHTCNEIPARHPVEAIGALCLTHKAYFHCDAVQGFVRESIDLAKEFYGSVVLSPHKFYGAKGVGILAFGKASLRAPLSPPYVGGEQEFGFRPGTLNTSAIAAAGVAVEMHEETRSRLREHLKQCDQVFVEEMTRLCPGFQLTVPATEAAPGIVNFYMEGFDAPSLLEKLKKVCMNRGASCTGAGGEKYSHVPRALGLPIEIQANVLRASFGWGCTIDDIKAGVIEIAAAIAS